MTKVSELHERWYREDPEYRAAYDASEPQFELINALLDARGYADIDQDELAERMGIHVTAIMRLEGWRSNPSVKTLRRVAEATGAKLKISFVPDDKIQNPPADVSESKHLQPQPLHEMDAVNAGGDIAMKKISEMHEKRYRESASYRAEYDASEPQFELISALIGARGYADIEQDELAARMGIHVTAIMRLEGWRSNPSVKTLRRVAEATGTKLKISFVPDDKIPNPPADVSESKQPQPSTNGNYIDVGDISQ